MDMSTERCGGKHCAWVFVPGGAFFVSYRTITGFITMGTAYATIRKYSQTTTKQMSQCFPSDATYMMHGEFEVALKRCLDACGVTYTQVAQFAKTGW